MSSIENDSLSLEKVLNESEVWSLSLEEIKDEKDFKTILLKSESEVNIENDFNAYFVLKKLKHLSNKNINRGESSSEPQLKRLKKSIN